VLSVPEDYVVGATRHEAAHVVIAAVQGLALRKDGLRISEHGEGLACYRGAVPRGVANVGPDPERERTIIAVYAGQIAHGRYYPPVANGDANASDDIDLADRLVSEMYSTLDLQLATKRKLWERSNALVTEHWEAIEGVAQALWSKPWLPSDIPRVPSHREVLEKKIDGEEVVHFLKQFGIEAVLDDTERRAPAQMKSA